MQVLAAAPVLSACQPQHLPDPFAAWRDPGAGEHDPRRFALAHAILAPNPHNTQAWSVALDDADGMTLYCDLERRLPFTDPFDRQITIGCGAFLELYRLAAKHLGYAAQVEFPPIPRDPRLGDYPLAHIRLGAREANPAGDPLFAQITARRTNRNPYDPARAPSEAQQRAMIDAAYAGGGELTFATEPDRVATLRDLVWRAWDRELHTAGAMEETYGWLRFGREEVARHGDGLAIDVPAAPLMKALGVLSRENLVNPESQANRQAARDWKRMVDTAPAFAWLSTIDDLPETRLTAGMAYARANLAATAAGLAIHPWSQALQEYEAMADLRRELQAFVQNGDIVPQMLVRVGHAAPVGPAARRGVAAVMREAVGSRQ